MPCDPLHFFDLLYRSHRAWPSDDQKYKIGYYAGGLTDEVEEQYKPQT